MKLAHTRKGLSFASGRTSENQKQSNTKTVEALGLQTSCSFQQVVAHASKQLKGFGLAGSDKTQDPQVPSIE